MPAPAAPSVAPGAPPAASQDLGPVAWVMADVRRCLETAHQALAGGEPAAARPPLHQAGGALEMAGALGVARVLAAMEGLAQQLSAPSPSNPGLLAQARPVMERAAFAVVDFLDALLHGRTVEAVALYPHYAELLALVGDARGPARHPFREHPAVLWTPPATLDSEGLRGLERPVPEAPVETVESIELSGFGPDQFHVEAPDAAPPAGPSAAELRAGFDRALLPFIKAGDPSAARALATLCESLVPTLPPAAGAPRRLWRLAAAFFEAQALAPQGVDLPAKRSASRLRVAFAGHAAALAQAAGAGAPPGDLASAFPDLEVLAHELLYTCAASGPVDDQQAPRLAALRAACGLAEAPALDHHSAPFGRYDPALLASARKRLTAAREGWAALAGGEVQQLRATVDHLTELGELLHRLHAPLAPLGQALGVVGEQVAASGAPAAPLAMEVATAILFLEALFQDFDPHDASHGARALRLAERLARVQRGAAPEPLEPWIEGLFRQAEGRQTLGSVVDELRASLGELEKDLDAFFRDRGNLAPLQTAPGRLSQMRGVLSVLGLDQAARAVLRMRDQVQALWAEPEGPRAAGLVEALGQSLGALGFLIDMLHYQPQLARELFVFDEARGLLQPVMGRVAPPPPSAPEDVAAQTLAPLPVPEPTPEPGPKPLPPVPPPTEPGRPPAPVEEPPPAPLPAPPVIEPPPVEADADAELRQVFLAEAREVLAAGREALAALAAGPADLAQLTVLRRCFHTLKGSARMVGLEPLGEAAWALEQLLNAWLAQAREADPVLRQLAGRALEGLGRWVEDLSTGSDTDWRAAPFLESADALRLHGQPWPLRLPGEDCPAEAPGPVPPPASPLLQPPSVEVARAGDAADLDAADQAFARGWTEEVREVGPLRIPAGLFNVFLQEADEDSLQLQEGLADWARAPDALRAPPSAEMETLAHSLAGSSATVGFAGLSELARQLELALQTLRGQSHLAEAFLLEASQPALLVEAAEHLRQLLHQFAAGFLREPDAGLVQALRALASVERAPARAPAASPGLEPDHGLDIDLGALPADQPDPLVFALFEEEALELLPRLDAAARGWMEMPDDAGAQAEVLRLLHTIKGGARLAGLMALGERTHDLESQAEALPPVGEPARARAVADLGQRIDQLQAQFEALRLRQSPASQALATAMPASDGLPTHADDVGVGVGVATSATLPDAAMALPAPAMAPPPSGLAPADASASLGAAAPGPGGTVRVRVQLLDRLMNQAGEVMITGARMESAVGGLREGLSDLSGSLDRLRQQLREAEIQAETQMQSRQARPPQPQDAPGFDPLELDRFSRMQELTRGMAESVNDIATVQRQLARAVDASEDDLSTQSRQTRDLQRDLLRTRMLEFGAIGERLRRVVRQAAQETGKQARLAIEGEALEIDRGMLDRLTPVFEHLLRNAVAHGLEPPAQRLQAGKPAAGRLQITLEQVGNDVALRFEDDGAGLDLARITAKARGLGLLGQRAHDTSDTSDTSDSSLSPQAAADLIFRPGFSTAASVSELAGRGVGLDVVRAEVQALGGRIEVESRPGAGCVFRLLLPLTTAVTHVVLMRCGTLRFGVPASLVETVLRSEPQALAAAQASGQWPGPVPFFWSGALLRVSPASQEAAGRAVPVALLQSAAQRLALQVDEVLGHREVVVKHLGPQLARLPGLAGMTVLASGEVVLIYNPVALAAIYGERARAFAAGEPEAGAWLREGLAAEAGAAPCAGNAQGVPGAAHGAAGDPAAAHRPTLPPLVLVVDDSLTVRRVTQRLLQREGYRVALAADGLQALERLAQEGQDGPALVLSDIEMPRMDGFELARHLRADPRWAQLPLVFITSRTADKHRAHAQALGVAHYLGKPYAEEALLALVRRYAQGSSAGAAQAGEAGAASGSSPPAGAEPGDQAAGFFTTA